MLSLPPSVRIYLCLTPTDMRRSFDALARMTAEILQADVFSGHLFVFRSRRGDRLKILYWDRDGLALWYKRLEQGVFNFPAARDSARVIVTPGELTMILDGIDISSARRGKRYGREPHAGQDILSAKKLD
jgi:transposase